MAQYEQSGDKVIEDIGLSPDVKPATKTAINNAINANKDASGNVNVVDVATVDDLTGLQPGATVVTVTADLFAGAPAGTTINAPVVIFSGTVPVNFTAKPGQVVISGEGDDRIVTIDGEVSPADLGITKGLVGAQADNPVEGINVDLAGGNDTIESGLGNDTIAGGAGNDSISSGAGGDSILAGTGLDSVDGGTGFDQVVMDNGGGAANYSFEVIDGEVIVTDVSGEITNVSNVEYIDLGDGAAIINTANTEDGTAARQSEAILGEQMTAAEMEEYQQLVDEIGLDAASAALMESSGFAADTADLTDAEYINLLYNQSFGRDVDPEGADFYAQQLADGIIDRAKLAADLNWSDEGIDSNDMVNQIDGLFYPHKDARGPLGPFFLSEF